VIFTQLVSNLSWTSRALYWGQLPIVWFGPERSMPTSGNDPMMRGPLHCKYNEIELQQFEPVFSGVLPFYISWNVSKVDGNLSLNSDSLNWSLHFNGIALLSVLHYWVYAICIHELSWATLVYPISEVQNQSPVKLVTEFF